MELTRRNFLTGAAACAGVAAVAGAAATANTAMAVEAPIANTNPDWLGEPPVIDPADISQTWDTDLLIVGAGNAGLMAAAKAAQLGMDFRIVEKGQVPGDTRDAYGAINTKYTEAAGCHIETDVYLGELSRYASGKCDQRVIKVFMEKSSDMIDFLADILDEYGYDIDFDDDTGLPTSGSQYYVPAQQHGQTAREDSEYADYTRNEILVDYIGKFGYSVDFGCDLVELIQDDSGAVVGAYVQSVDDDSYIQINAKNVLLACGGYGANLEMVKDLQPLASNVITVSQAFPQDTGQGIKAALWIGAQKDVEPTAMIFDRGLVPAGTDAGIIQDENGNYVVPGGNISTRGDYNAGTQPFLKVNRKGERFANESCPYNDILFASVHNPGHVYCQIYDGNYEEDWQQFHTLGCSSLTRKAPAMMTGVIDDKVEEGVICKADTLEELAQQMGLDEEAQVTFLATVERYNELYDAQDDVDFGKAAYRLSAIRTAPFYGAWLGGIILTTGDGLSINTKQQVLDTQNNVIPGLYAAGDVSGCFFSGNYPNLFPGTCCGRGMTGALNAIETISGE